MPKQGQSVETCVIVGWKKRAGDAVKAGEVLCEVETDKATSRSSPPRRARSLPSSTRREATCRCWPPSPPSGSRERTSNAPAEAAPRSPRRRGCRRGAARGAAVSARLPRRAATCRRREEDHGLPAGQGPCRGQRRLARGHPRDRARAAASSSATCSRPSPAGSEQPARQLPAGTRPAAAPSPWPGGVREIKVTGVRKLIAERMLASLADHRAAHPALRRGRARAAGASRKKFKEAPKPWGCATSRSTTWCSSPSRARSSQHPDLNAHFSGDTIRQFADVHLGFAVDTPRGLMVPVIRNAARPQPAGDRRARPRGWPPAAATGGITPDEMAGGTFTVTNLGGLGVQGFTPVLNVPQVGILGVGAIVPRASAGRRTEASASSRRSGFL